MSPPPSLSPSNFLSPSLSLWTVFLSPQANSPPSSSSSSLMPYNGMLPFFPPNLLLHNSHDEDDDQAHHFRGMEMAAAAAAAAASLGKRSAVPSFSGGMEAGGCGEDVNEENASDGSGSGGLQAAAVGGERKRKLSLEQARVLEKNFEMGSKLEPERKMELARTLGLQPRQIAIWFQNRRARWKTKQLEKEYDELKRNFEMSRRENDALQAQNKKLLSQLLALKGKETQEPINLNKETEGSCSMRSDNSSDINLDISRASINDNSTSNHNLFPFYKTPSSSHHLLPQFVHQHNNSSSSISRKEEGSSNNNLCNIFCSSSDEQSAFWTWSEQQQQQHSNNKFHHH